MNSPNALVIMSRVPRPGHVKRRLQPPLSGEEAAALYAAMVEDLVDALRVDGRWALAVFCAPAEELAAARSWLGEGVSLYPQSGTDLGARMQAAVTQSFEQGCVRVVVIGGDAPDIDAELVAQAFAALEDHDLVLGPSRDGGYYLIGLRGAAPEIFTDMPWGTDTVLSRTLERADRIRLSTKLLAEMEDIDTWETLCRLQLRLADSGPAGSSTSLLRTRKAVLGIFRERAGQPESGGGTSCRG